MGFFLFLLPLLWIIVLLVKNSIKTTPTLCSCFSISIPHKSINLLSPCCFYVTITTTFTSTTNFVLVPSSWWKFFYWINFSRQKNSNNSMPQNFFLKILESEVCCWTWYMLLLLGFSISITNVHDCNNRKKNCKFGIAPSIDGYCNARTTMHYKNSWLFKLFKLINMFILTKDPW